MASDDIILIGGRRHTVWTCKTCGVLATCPTDLMEYHRKSGGYHSCPNGHRWGWSKENSEDEQIRRERDRLKQKLAEKDDQIRRERERREAAERSASASRGQVTKMKNRAAAGVCPCCNRSFENLRRHMTAKHPGFKAEDVA